MVEELYYEKSKIKTNGIYWYSNKKNSQNIDPKLKALYHCIELVKENELVIHKSNNIYRMWGIGSESELIKMTETNNHIFEVLLENNQKKVYFDIDIKPSEAKGSFTEHLKECKKIIMSMFKQPNFQVSGSESESKFSYHIILSNYVFNNEFCLLKSFAEFYKDYGFDPSVFNKNKNMKCINQSKGFKQDNNKKWVKDPRIQSFIEGNQNHSKHLITCDFDETFTHLKFMDFSDYKVILKTEQDTNNTIKLRKRLEHKKKGIDILNIKPSTTNLPLSFDYANATNLEKLQVLPNENLTHDIQFFVMCWCKQNQISFDDFWLWCSKKSSTNERLDRYTSYWNGFEYNVRRQYIDNILEMYYPRLKKDYNYQRYEDYLKVPTEFKKTLVGENYIDIEDIGDSGVYVLGVGCGRGKTETAIKDIQRNMDKRVLFIVPRITLSYDIHNRLKKSNIEFTNYKDLKSGESLGHMKREIISPCSLHKLDLTSYNFNQGSPYDTLIIDEFETLIDMFLNNKIHGGKLAINWNLFINLLKTTKKVIIMDAITTKKTHNFLTKLNLKYFYIDDVRPDFLELNRVVKKKDEKCIDTEHRFFNLLMNDLKNNKKCFVFTPYKESRKENNKDSISCIRGVMPLMNFICDKLNFVKGVDIEGYYAEAYEEKLGLHNVNKTWSSMKCVITNTCNSVGINYENFDFDNIYLFISDWNNIRDVLQALRRIRNIKNKKITIYYEPKNKSDIYEKMYPSVDEFITEYKTIIDADKLERTCYNIESFYMLCKINGIIPSANIDDADLEKLIKFDENDDYRITYDRIDDIDEERLLELYKKYEGGLISLREKYEIEKYRFKLKYTTIDNIILREIWLYRDYCNKFDELYNSNTSNHIINQFLELNNVYIFKPNFESFPIDGRIPFTLDIKGLVFMEKFKYIKNIKNYEQDTYVKIINAFFGMGVLQKELDSLFKPIKKTINSKQYISLITSLDFINTLNLYKKYSRNFKNRETCLITEESYDELD